MAYAALGRDIPSATNAMREVLLGRTRLTNFIQLAFIDGTNFNGTQDALHHYDQQGQHFSIHPGLNPDLPINDAEKAGLRNKLFTPEDMAHAIQKAYVSVVVDIIADGLSRVSDHNSLNLDENRQFAIDGIIISGGCALNVQANYELRKRFHKPVFVPSAPGDSGLAVGTAWFIHPPSHISDLSYWNSESSLSVSAAHHIPPEVCRLLVHTCSTLRTDVKTFWSLKARRDS